MLPNINGPIPRNRFTGPDPFASDHRMMSLVGYDLTHQFNTIWSIRNAYRYTIAEESHLKSATLMITNVIGHFQLFNMDHRFLAGVELRQDKRNPFLQS
jgi:iron complex outermembrane receptor protein